MASALDLHPTQADRLEPQPDEPDLGDEFNPREMPNMTQPDMLLTAEAGLLPELTGGPDLLAELREAVEEARAEESGGL